MTFSKNISWFVLGGLAVYLLGNQSAPQQCTAIKVPETTHQTVWVNGQKTAAPVELSRAFIPIVSTVELPSGFRAVGGGSGVVIACN